jgi:hypothetical protein
MEPRTQYYVSLLAGVVTLILPIADHIKRIPASFGIFHIVVSVLMAGVWFGLAIRAKKEIPRYR